METIGVVTQRLLRPIFQSKPHMSLMMDWGHIMTQEIAANTWPLKLVPMGRAHVILYLNVKPEKALWAWSITKQILSRVNQYLGCASVSHVKWVPTTMSDMAEIESEKPLENSQ